MIFAAFGCPWQNLWCKTHTKTRNKDISRKTRKTRTGQTTRIAGQNSWTACGMEPWTVVCKRFTLGGINFKESGWIPRRVVSAYDVVNASYLPTTINIYDLEIRSINNYRKSYDIASFLVSTKISRRCRFGNSKPCKYIRSSYVRRNCIYDNNRVSANISSYDYR